MPLAAASDERPPETRSAAPPAAGGLRALAESLVCLVVLVVLFRTFLVEGYMISTGSMAPCLLGFHKRVVCPTCGFLYAVGVAYDESVPEAEARGPGLFAPYDGHLSTCPNCGQDSIDIAAVPRSQGDQLLVRKAAGPPRRWEVVVFRNPARPSQVYVKRVAGLPGETVQIIDGDLYIDGRIARKDYEMQRAMRMLVHDHDHRPGAAAWPDRWTPLAEPDDPERIAWRAIRRGFLIEGAMERPGAHAFSPQEPQWAWVGYRHGARSGDAQEAEAHVVSDEYGYNAPGTGAAPVPVRDLMLSAQLAVQRGHGEFAVEMTDGRQTCALVLDFEADEVRLVIDGSGLPVRTAPLPEGLRQGLIEVEVSLFDRQVLVAVNGALPFEAWPLPDDGPGWGGTEAPREPVRFGAQGLDLVVRSLKLYRDVHYTRGRARNGVDEPHRLGLDEYFMLGDNSPVSSDSRNWAHGGVPARLLLGKPFLVHLPSKPGELRLGGVPRHFRIPDVSRIRYIR